MVADLRSARVGRCQANRTRKGSFYARKELNFFQKLFEVNEIKIDETSERRNELTRGK